MDKASMEVRARGWMNAIHEANASGMGAEAWCREHGVSRSTFYRWKKRLRENALQETGAARDETKRDIQKANFAEVVIPRNTAEGIARGISERQQEESRIFRIQSGGMVIEIPVTIEEAEITKILQAVRNVG